jgi:hypothetical protein
MPASSAASANPTRSSVRTAVACSAVLGVIEPRSGLFARSGNSCSSSRPRRPPPNAVNSRSLCRRHHQNVIHPSWEIEVVVRRDLGRVGTQRKAPAPPGARSTFCARMASRRSSLARAAQDMPTQTRRLGSTATATKASERLRRRSSGAALVRPSAYLAGTTRWCAERPPPELTFYCPESSRRLQ